MKTKMLHFKWTVSRGRNSYGYNICTLLVDGVKKGQCNGGGYDMKGTSLAYWLTNDFQPQLLELFSPEILAKENYSKRFYGVHISEKSKSVYLDGACGFSSIERIANAIGVKLIWNPESTKRKHDDFYTAIIE